MHVVDGRQLPATRRVEWLRLNYSNSKRMVTKDFRTTKTIDNNDFLATIDYSTNVPPVYGIGENKKWAIHEHAFIALQEL